MVGNSGKQQRNCEEIQVNTAKDANIEKQDKECEENQVFKDWLKGINLIRYHDILQKNGFDDFDAISTVNLNQLNEIGIDKIGHRQKLMKHIQRLDAFKYEENLKEMQIKAKGAQSEHSADNAW